MIIGIKLRLIIKINRFYLYNSIYALNIFNTLFNIIFRFMICFYKQITYMFFF
jgi:hypothetical protein